MHITLLITYIWQSSLGYLCIGCAWASGFGISFGALRYSRTLSLLHACMQSMIISTCRFCSTATSRPANKLFVLYAGCRNSKLLWSVNPWWHLCDPGCQQRAWKQTGRMYAFHACILIHKYWNLRIDWMRKQSALERENIYKSCRSAVKALPILAKKMYRLTALY